MNDNTGTVRIEVGPLSLLLILFIGLKLGHVITWSWWWVFAPMWAPVAFMILLVCVLLLSDDRR